MAPQIPAGTKKPAGLGSAGFWGCLVPIVGIELTTYRLQGGLHILNLQGLQRFVIVIGTNLGQ